MYRKQDFQFLQDIFDRSSNDIAILYGTKDTGLNEMVSDLCKDKEALYYRACEVSDMMQRELFANELHEQTRSSILPHDDYDKLLASFILDGSGHKKLIIFDCFDRLIDSNPTFINFLSDVLLSKSAPGLAMVLLVCDDVNWIEKDMINKIGKKSSEISGVLKLNEYTPTMFREVFPDMPLRELIGIYSVIGGKSSYYNGIDNDTTLRQVLIEMLTKWGRDDLDKNSFLPRGIREPAVYNTILTCIARGVNKLNDIHNATNIDRAKLSVYIRTLIDSDIVKKAVSANVGTGADTCKGMYLISDRLVLFYYRFVFPHVSSLRILGAERFYRKFIERGINGFVEEAYPYFCMEQVRWLSSNGRLNFKVSRIEEYYDKNGTIDFVIIAAGGSVIACACRYSPPHMSYKLYEQIKATVRKNKILCDNIWLFSAGGFDQKLSMTGAVTLGLNLIDGADQRLR